MKGWLLIMVFAIPILGHTQQPAAKSERTSKDKAQLVEYVNPPGLAVNPRFTQLVEISGGRTILISGQVAVDKDGKTVGKGDIHAQATQVFENLKTALNSIGASFNDVVKLTTFIVDIPTNLPAIRDVRSQYLSSNEHLPASTTVGVAGLVNPDFLLEMEAVVVVPDKRN